ncbi:NLR family CARD domain-containing protein 4-like isoform X2 [Apostichopus japonicus]|uniref:NLR family CARD domain-containing protein 4-like isoform X2 n=1 Tax=Stichopus japonicus TaxID=307972 RepID=UPI003AB72E5C
MELTPDLQEKKQFLIEGLKRTYKGQYDAIQPLPYIKDRLYCVDKVFVEGGVEVCLAPEPTPGTRGSWERLDSYKSIYTDYRFKSKRRIIQGEPGYGKSTLTLQLAYDWCNDVSDSPMNNVEILILLRLRQLGRVKSLYRAIKSFLLFHEPRVSKHELEKIIHSCSSVHIILDGYDEYPGRDSNDNDDVHKIIKMELFADFDVSLTTRYLPGYLRKETMRAKLTGFDDKARNEYICKAVVSNNDEAVEEIKQRLNENSILADLCQVPLIFVMFAHMAHDQRDLMKFKSVTKFFKHMIRCFYDHLKQKFKGNRSNDFYLHEMEHHELDKIAFEGLNKENQQLSWNKTRFRQRIGRESYDQYISIGILVEEDEVNDDSTGDNVLFTTMVRFYHKLFCEWYAAHHLVTLVKNAHNLSDILRFVDPFDLQYLFRFACGLNPNAGKKLINHLKSLPDGDKFAILCILEQTGDVNNIMDSVKELCSRVVKIERGDSALLQRSTTQLLEIASKNHIPISCVHLWHCSPRVDESGLNLILQSGLSLSILSSLQELRIWDNRRLTNEELAAILSYSSQCTTLKELLFSWYILPDAIPVGSIPPSLKSRNVKVWNYKYQDSRRLNLQTGQWQACDGNGNLPGEEGFNVRSYQESLAKFNRARRK